MEWRGSTVTLSSPEAHVKGTVTDFRLSYLSSLSIIMPDAYEMRAIFTGFPGGNGSDSAESFEMLSLNTTPLRPLCSMARTRRTTPSNFLLLTLSHHNTTQISLSADQYRKHVVLNRSHRFAHHLSRAVLSSRSLSTSLPAFPPLLAPRSTRTSSSPNPPTVSPLSPLTDPRRSTHSTLPSSTNSTTLPKPPTTMLPSEPSSSLAPKRLLPLVQTSRR